MKLTDYLNTLKTRGGVFAPLALAELIRRTAQNAGLSVCTGAYDAENRRVVLYLN